MKKLLGFLAITLVAFTPLSVMAQSQQQKNELMFARFTQQFQDQQVDSIYALTGENFRKNVSLATLHGVAAQLFKLGPIKESSLITYRNSISTYKLVFDQATLQLSLSVDSLEKLETLLFKPYKDAVADKPYSVPGSNPLQTQLDKRVDTIARSYIQKENTVGLIIGIFHNGVMRTYGYGSTEKGKSNIPHDSTLFEIGSVSKTFTSLLLAHYAVQSKLSISDPVTRYLPDSVASNPALTDITLLHLSNHTSGLPRMPSNFMDESVDPLNPYKEYSDSRLFSALRKVQPSTPPGKEDAYSNFGVALLGVILERISGRSYDEMVKEIIGRPLNMYNTIQFLSTAQNDRFVHVYNDNGTKTPAWDFRAMAPAGALRSTVSDLVRYGKAYLAKTGPLSAAMALTMAATQSNPAMGLGWHIRDTRGNATYWHNGGTYGSSSFIAFIPAKDVVVVVLSNAAAAVDDISLSLLDVIVN